MSIKKNIFSLLVLVLFGHSMSAILYDTLVSDDFNNNSLDTTIWGIEKLPTGTISEKNGRIEIYGSGDKHNFLYYKNQVKPSLDSFLIVTGKWTLNHTFENANLFTRCNPFIRGQLYNDILYGICSGLGCLTDGGRAGIGAYNSAISVADTQLFHPFAGFTSVPKTCTFKYIDDGDSIGLYLDDLLQLTLHYTVKFQMNYIAFSNRGWGNTLYLDDVKIIRGRNISTSVEKMASTPSILSLAASPNPTNSAISLTIGIPATSTNTATVRIIGVSGRLIHSWKLQGAGSHQIVWSGNDNSQTSLASGMYIVQVSGAGMVLKNKIMLRK